MWSKSLRDVDRLLYRYWKEVGLQRTRQKTHPVPKRHTTRNKQLQIIFLKTNRHRNRATQASRPIPRRTTEGKRTRQHKRTSTRLLRGHQLGGDTRRGPDFLRGRAVIERQKQEGTRPRKKNPQIRHESGSVRGFVLKRRENTRIVNHNPCPEPHKPIKKICKLNKKTNRTKRIAAVPFMGWRLKRTSKKHRGQGPEIL